MKSRAKTVTNCKIESRIWNRFFFHDSEQQAVEIFSHKTSGFDGDAGQFPYMSLTQGSYAHS